GRLQPFALAQLAVWQQDDRNAQVEPRAHLVAALRRCELTGRAGNTGAAAFRPDRRPGRLTAITPGGDTSALAVRALARHASFSVVPHAVARPRWSFPRMIILKGVTLRRSAKVV